MHFILQRQIEQAVYIDDNRETIKPLFGEYKNVMQADFKGDATYKGIIVRDYQYWTNYLFTFEFQAMDITYLMYGTWMFTF